MSDAKREVDARIVYWGIAGAGKTSNLRAIHGRLRPDHRGALRAVPTRLDPTVSYELLPIELGEVQGVKTRLQIVSVPGGAEHAPTRKQLLDRVDGVVFVIDAQRERIDENVAALDELRAALSDYGRALGEVPIVLQYNKQDLADPSALEELHRKLDVKGVAAFEAIASNGTGVLQTLTTISKQVVRTRREPAEDAARPAPAPPAAEGVTAPLRGATPAAAPIAPPAAAAPPAAPTPIPVAAAPEARLPLEALREPLAQPPQATASLAADQALVSARAALEGPGGGAAFRDVAGALHAEAMAEAEAADGSTGELAIVSAGQARVLSPRSVAVPLILSDDRGREHRVMMTIQLDPAAAAASTSGAPGASATTDRRA